MNVQILSQQVLSQSSFSHVIDVPIKHVDM
jgi:hypothetical protein